ncbi:SRPBCC domain-containing protein [Haladaptatus sp. CMAA 1911]|uniref:SRPBCC domain-containing protein n=1 Tax=unclassified Haladaptatus TaxID=2622732 RepID=UPI003754D12F
MIETNETSLTIRRTFDAARERVWTALTNPEEVDQWWGPNEFTTTTDEMDVQPGGVWRFLMTGADGQEYPNQIVYNEIAEPERLAYTHGSPDDPEQFRVTITLNDVGDTETELAMEMRFSSAVDLDEALEHGADEGARQTLDRLANHLANNREGQ